MHPANWMEVALGSGSKVRILRLLASDPAKVRTEREIAAAVRMSPNTIHRAIRDLQAHGVLEVRRIGPVHAVRLPPDPKITRDLQRIFQIERDALPLLQQAIRHALPAGAECYLYGSTQRGDAGRESDVDLLIIAGTTDAAEEAAARVREAVFGAFPARLEIITLTRAEANRRAHSGLVKSVLQEGTRLRAGKGAA